MIVLPIILLAKRVKRVSRQLQSNQEKFASVLIDFLAGIQTVKIFAMEAFSFKKYKEQNDRMAVLGEQDSEIWPFDTADSSSDHDPLLGHRRPLWPLYAPYDRLRELIVFCGLLQMSYEPVKKFADENCQYPERRCRCRADVRSAPFEA